ASPRSLPRPSGGRPTDCREGGRVDRSTGRQYASSGLTRGWPSLLTLRASARRLLVCLAVFCVPSVLAFLFPSGGYFLLDSLVPVADLVYFAKIEEVLPLPV